MITIRLAILLSILASGCGSKPPKAVQSLALPTVEAAFNQASQEFGIPKRLLMAVGYLESRLVPTMGSAAYVAIDQGTGPLLRGTFLTETAFGLPMSTLGLDPKQASSETLEVQIKAYAAYVANSLASKGLSLKSSATSPEEIFQWIESLSTIHRRGMTQRRNVQIIFARELIETLNGGFIWQDPNKDQTLVLPPEPQKIQIDSFPVNGRNWFKLTELESELRLATYLPLVTVASGENRDQPRRIEVLHCPLSLSACLELQTRSEESQIRLAAHYVIHQEKNLLGRMIQVADHTEAMVLTEPTGESLPHKGSVVLMLVGSSGRIVKGVRTPAYPIWFNDQQLRNLGQLINDLCTLFSQKDSGFKREECMSIGGENGVKFHHQGPSEEYTWGMIADFDPTIFEAYIKNPSGLGSEVAFDPQVGQMPTQAGQPITFKMLFDNESRMLEIERLSRCPDGKVLWEPVRHLQVRGQNAASITESFFDSGPNRDGGHFFRVRVYAKDSKLLGWATQKIGLTKFETEPYFASEKLCKLYN